MDILPPNDISLDALLLDWIEQTKQVQEVYGISRQNRDRVTELLANKAAAPVNPSALRMPTMGTSAALRLRRLLTLNETITQLKADIIDVGGIPTRFLKYVEELSVYTSKNISTLQPKPQE